MTDATPYLWLAESHRTLLRDRYGRASDVWSQRWLQPSVKVLSPDLELTKNSETSGVGAGEVWSLENGSRCYAIVEFGMVGSFQTLFDRIVASPLRSGRPRQSSPVALEVGQALLADWVMEFTGLKRGAEREPLWRSIELAASHEIVGRGALRMTFQVGGIEINLLIPGRTVREWLPRMASKATMPLTPMMQAAATASVKLQVSLDSSEGLTLEALENLSAGDIVLLDRDARDNWTLAGPDGRPMAACAPGHIGSHYAVQVLGPS